MWYYCPCWTSQIFYQIIFFQPVPLSSSAALHSIRHSPSLVLFTHLLNVLSHHPGNSFDNSSQSQRDTAGSWLPIELCTHYQLPQAQQSGSFSTHLFVHLVRISWWSYQDTTGDHVRGFAEAEMHSIHYFLFLKTVSSHHRRHSDQWGTIHPAGSVLSLPDGLFLLHVVITSKIILVIILEADVRLTSPQLPDFFSC